MILKNLTNIPKVKTKLVKVPELQKNGEIIIRQMTISETIIFNILVNEHAENGLIVTEKNIMAKLISSMVDEEGNHIAKPSELLTLVENMPHKVASRLYVAYLELNDDVETTSITEKKSKS